MKETKWTRREAVAGVLAAAATGGAIALAAGPFDVLLPESSRAGASDDALLDAIRAADQPRAAHAVLFVAEGES